MKFRSKSSTSLVSLVSGGGDGDATTTTTTTTTTSYTERSSERKSRMDTGRFSLMQFLPLPGGGGSGSNSNKKGGGGGSSSRLLGQRRNSTSSSSLMSLADENRSKRRSLNSNDISSSSPPRQQNQTFLRRNSKSTISLRSLASTGSINGGISSSPPRQQNQTFLRRNSKSTMSLKSLGSTGSINGGSSSSQPRQNHTFLRRNSKSTVSLGSLGNNNGGGGEDSSSSSSCSTFTNLATPKAILQLEEFDDDLGLIGYPRHHHRDHTCTEESNTNQSSSSSSIVIERVDRNDYRKVCFIGKGCHADVYMVTNPNTRENFALKSLNPKRIKDPEILILAATDLAMEAKILNGLNHENIIQLKGICSTSFSQSFTEGTDEGYFLILDLLEEVFSDRLERWRKDSNKLSSYENKWSLTSPKLNIKQMYGRMENVALGIVKGMIYLHEKGIILRDLKPQNIGFDKEGKVRLFDFGMARKLADCNFNDICGSPRYMDPSLMAGEGYTLKADVYSFGIILYELCSLTIAYGKINNYPNLEEFNCLLVEHNMRPKLTRIACPLTRTLIEDCWQNDPNGRPSFLEIYQRIKEILTITTEESTPVQLSSSSTNNGDGGDGDGDKKTLRDDSRNSTIACISSSTELSSLDLSSL